MLFPIDREVYLPFILWSLAIGFVFGAIYDIFRIRRAAFRLASGNGKREGKGSRLKKAVLSDTVIIFFEDILFSLFCSVVMILLAFKLHFGIPRWYSLFSALVGFLTYRNTLGRLVIASAEAIISLICRIVSKITELLRKYVVSPIALLLTIAVDKTVSAVSKKRKKKYNSRYEKRILSLTEKRLSYQSRGQMKGRA